jgi:hypothetical protein
MALTHALKDIVNKMLKKDPATSVNGSVNIVNTRNNAKELIRDFLHNPSGHLKNHANNIKQDKKRALPLLTGLLMILLPIAYLALMNPEEVKADWFNEDWTFRKKTIVTNNTTEETDVYIQFDGTTQFIDTSDSTKWQGDCDDLRITDYNGRILKHYISSGCGTASTIVQVYYDTFIAGDQVIYYYYGNPTVTTGAENSAFTTEASNYSIGAAATEEIGPGPVGYWKFDEGYGTTIQDSTVHNNDGTALGSTAQDPSIEQQINIIDQEVTAVGIDRGIVAIDTSNYTSATYYFEVVAKVTSGTGTTALTINAGTDPTPSGGTTVPITNITDTSFARYRSSSFSPSGDQNAYVSDISGTGTTLKAARVIILQSAPSIPDTEIQIEVGNNETTTETSATTLTDPKIFQYDDDGYSGTANAYFEATIKSADFVSAQSTNATFPQTAVSYADTTNLYDDQAWRTPQNISADDDTNVADIVHPAFDDPAFSEVIRATNFGFAGIAAGSTITGIEVVIDRSASSGSASEPLVQLVYNNAGNENDRIGNNKNTLNAWPATAATQPYGGPGDVWGATLNATSVQNSNFGVDVAVQATSANTDVEIDYITMKIYYTQSGSGTAYAELYNRTDSATVTNSAISTSSSTWQRIRGSSALTTNWDTTNDDEYEVRIYTSASEAPVSIANAKIVLDQNQGGGIADTQMFHMYNNTSATDNDASYSAQNFLNYFDPANLLSSGTFAGYFESTLRTSNASNAYYARLDIPAGEVTASDTVPTLNTSSNIWSSLPSTASDVDIELRNNTTDTTTSSGSWLKLQATTLGGTPQVDPTWKTDDECLSGKCMEYDGANSVTTVTNANAIDLDQYLSTGVTFQAWVRAYSDGESNLGEIFNKGSNTYLKVSNEGADGQLDLEASLDLATTNAATTIPNILELNVWHHVAMGYTDDGDDEITIYVDGVNVGASTNGDGTPTTDSNDLSIGGSGDYNFDGLIDDFKIYPYERTSAEVQTDFNARGVDEGTSVRVGPESGFLTEGLIGHWKLDESSGDAFDSSGSGLTLTNNGSTTYVDAKYANGSEHVPASSQHFSTASAINNVQTVAFWVSPDATTNYYISLNLTAYITSSSGTITATGFSNPSIYVNGVETTTIAADEWQHVVVTTETETDADQFYLGRQGSNYFDGTLDDVRVYNKSFSTSEVRQLSKWAPGPVGYWKFDEGSGTTQIQDSSGNDNYATLSGFTESSWEKGKFGDSLYFDGTSSVATVANESAFDFEQDDAFSISSWVKVVGDNSEQKIFNKMDNGAPNRGYEFFVHNDNFLSAYLISSWSGDAIFVQGNTAINDDQWHHVAMTYAGTSTAPDVKLYLDGVLESTSINNDSLASTILTDISPNIGNRNGGSLYFEGNIDELKVYNYERTQEQIIEDMNAGHPAPGSPIGSPVGWWKFDEGYGDTAYDSGPQGNDGNLQGSCPGGGNCPTWIDDGKYGNALDYDGNDYIVVSDDPSLRPDNGSWSVSAWAKPDDANQIGTIISKRQNASPYEQWSMMICANNGCWASGQQLVGIFIEDDDALDRRAISNSDVADGEWHHYVMVADKSSDKILLYMDGAEIITSTTWAGSWPTIDNPDDLQIGNNNNTEYFNGAIDEIRVYNFALTGAQVSAEYNQGKAAVFGALSTTAGGSAPSYSANRELCPPGDSDTCSAPIALYKLDEKTGSSAYDTSTNNYVGALTGAQWEPAIFCKSGACLSFNGSSDYVDIGSGPGTVRTMEMWVYPETTTEYLMDLSGTDYLWIDSSTVTATNVTSPNIYVDGVETDYITADEWHHVVVTTSTSENASDFDLARTAGSNYLQGKLDNVVLYDYVRTPAQIAWSYNKGGPIGWWKFDECQGSTAYDSSGKGNNGIILAGSGPNSSVGTCDSGAGDEMWDNGTNGRLGASLDFDGTDDYIATSTPISTLTDNFSLTIWLNWDGTTAENQFAFLNGSGGCDGWGLKADNANSDQIEILAQCSGTARSTEVLPTGTWKHLTVVRRNAAFELYFDGKEIPLTTPSGYGVITPATRTIIGAITPATSWEFDGQIDEVKYFEYPLTKSQVETEFNNGAVRFE